MPPISRQKYGNMRMHHGMRKVKTSTNYTKTGPRISRVHVNPLSMTSIVLDKG